MSRFENPDSDIQHYNHWPFYLIRRPIESSSESEQETSGNSSVTEQDKREALDESKSHIKRVNKKNKCYTEPFYETLRLLDELF